MESIGISDKCLKDMDYIVKINMWLTERYMDDVAKHFQMEGRERNINCISAMFRKMYEEQNEKMPLPFYEYGLGHKGD